MDPPPTSCVRVRVLARPLSACVSDLSPPSHLPRIPTNTTTLHLNRPRHPKMFPSPRDLLPLFHCPLCPPDSLLAAPTTLRCGHTVCAHHLNSTLCPVPSCPTQHQSFTPNIPPSSRVAFFPAPLSPQNPPPVFPHPPLDVRVNNIIHLLHAANDPIRFSVPLGYSDDDSDPEDSHTSDSTSSHPPHNFEKALSTELSCEICFMLLYQPVTTPCQHVRPPSPPHPPPFSPPYRIDVLFPVSPAFPRPQHALSSLSPGFPRLRLLSRTSTQQDHPLSP